MKAPAAPNRPADLPMLQRLLLLTLVLAAGACRGTRKASDPVLRIHTEGGTELGVSTAYGVVFLGTTATSGHVDLEAFYGDGPSLEPSVIEPLGGGLYTADPEIRLPEAPMHFATPEPGDVLLIIGHGPTSRWEAWSTVRGDERVRGVLLDVPGAIEGRTDQVGAGVFWVNPQHPVDRRLVGLVSGRITLDGREYLAVVGQDDLWRLVTYRRDHLRRKRRVYREDIM
jgi:hypothetical protein